MKIINSIISNTTETKTLKMAYFFELNFSFCLLFVLQIKIIRCQEDSIKLSEKHNNCNYVTIMSQYCLMCSASSNHNLENTK